jgi:hypothetical protein
LATSSAPLVRLHFHGFGGTSVTLGPAPWFRVSGNFIRQGPDGVVVATLRSHQWQIESRHFTRFECEDATLIHFEDMGGSPTENFGPYPAFYTADGVMYASEKLFAKFIEETQLWHCYVTENFWPAIVIKAAPR